jgi:6-phosphogluconate dehydrogenase
MFYFLTIILKDFYVVINNNRNWCLICKINLCIISTSIIKMVNMLSKANFGLFGLGVMGTNLARNIVEKNHRLAVYNRNSKKLDSLLELYYSKFFVPTYKIEDFVKSIEAPRKILIVVEAGQAVDDVTNELFPFLESGDIIIDLGNSNWKDTQLRQEKYLKADKTIHWIGCGMSGGERGAYIGPCFMPSGDEESITKIFHLLESISARDFSGKPSVTLVGKGASGHFVKMTHNAIEYALMQGIIEIYDYLKNEVGLSNLDIAGVFDKFNSADETSKTYLIEITIDILKSKDEFSANDLLDMVLSASGNKGTGRWSIQSALDLGVAAPTLASALFVRYISAQSNHFINFKKSDPQLNPKPQAINTDQITSAFKLFMWSVFSQGIEIIQAANKKYNWDIDITEILRIWQGGCIIRTNFLLTLQESVQSKNLVDLDSLEDLSDLLSKIGTPSLALSSSLHYLKNRMRETLPTNLIQAQRDYFGMHGYKRIDRNGDFSGGWIRSGEN